MKIKTYKDGTYNIFFEIGDFVKVKSNDKFASPKSKEGTWGKVKKVTGKKAQSVAFEDADGESHIEFVWNLIGVDSDGKQIPESQLFKLTPIKESRVVKSFFEWNSRRFTESRLSDDISNEYEPAELYDYLDIEELEEKYPNAKITMNTIDKFEDRYFARVDITKQNGELEYLGALKGPVSKQEAIEFFNDVLDKEYDKYY
jgi:hypothetical protein